MIDLDTALNQKLLNVAIGQVEPQIPAHREHAGTFVLHCHNLEHEDLTMMADVVTA